MKNLFILLAVAFSIPAQAQIADGSIAPDFTLTDKNGTTHNLYAYLNDGKTVIVEIFAAHCPTCWNYHQTNKLKDLYNAYGPDATDEVMVLALEYDQGNDNDAFIGIGDPWFTQGNWLEGTPYPIFNVEGADRQVFSDYNVTFYPAVYKICPDKVVEGIATSESVAQLYEKVQVCQSALSITETSEIGDIYYNPVSQQLTIEKYQDVKQLKLVDMSGRVLQTINQLAASTIPLSGLPAGMYLVDMRSDNGRVVRRLFLGSN